MFSFPKTGNIQRLEKMMVAFFVLCALSLIIVYLLDPSIYLSKMLMQSSASNRYPLPATVLLVALLVFIAMIIYGVLHHWRWLFWLLLLAFSASILDFPAILLAFAGVLPADAPAWYGFYRMGIALFEVGLAVWMIQIYRRAGVWGLGRKRSEKLSQANS